MPQEPLDLADTDGAPRRLTVEDVAVVAREHRRVHPLEEDPSRHRSLERAMADSVRWVDEQVAALDEGAAHPIYGINTGFGALAGRQTFRSSRLARVLSRNLLVSHAAGTGPPLPEDTVRAAVLVRAHQLAQGRSGVRISVVNRLLGLLNAGIYPVVPSFGSLGASGDLAPLAHLALVVSRAPELEAGDVPLPVDHWPGEAWLRLEASGGDSGPADRVTHDHFGQPRHWRRATGEVAMAPLGGQIVLNAKEGLALSNGTSVSAALLALAVADAGRLLDHAELALAMTLEAVRGFRDAFLAEVHHARGYPGALAVAERVLAYTDGSSLLDRASREHDPERVPPQDPYSVRCGPQVLGAGRDALDFARRTVEIELNAAVDNPLIFLDLPRAYKAVSGGNFHGAPLGYALDLLKVVATDCASQSERRTFKLMDFQPGSPDGELALPSFLVPAADGEEGLNSGLMIAQYTAAALVSACKTLAHPDSVDSIPSSANQEDHVSMSLNAGLHATAILRNAEAVIGIEILTAAQALGLRLGQGSPGAGVAAAVTRLRREVQPLEFDRVLAPDIEATVLLMRSGALLTAAQGAVRHR